MSIWAQLLMGKEQMTCMEKFRLGMVRVLLEVKLVIFIILLIIVEFL